MCRELDALRQAIVDWATGFDARSLTPAQAGSVVLACARMEASIGSVKALAAARAAEGSSWRHEGYRSPADQLAHQIGTSASSARRALEAGRRMADQPQVADAALGGDLSPDQAAAVSDGVAADPTRARELIDKARHLSMPELNDEVARAKAAATDQEARRQERHSRRSFTRFTDRDGALHGRLYGHPEDGATIWRMIDPIRRRLNMARRQAAATGPDPIGVEPLEALDYDSLKLLADLAVGNSAELSPADLIDLGLFPGFATAQPSAGHPSPPSFAVGRPAAEQQGGPGPAGTGPSTCGPPPVLPGQADLFSPVGADPPPVPGSAPPSRPARGRKLAGSPVKVIFRIDLDAFFRGVPLEGELCDLVGYGPVPVSTIKDLVASDQTLIAFALTKGRQVVSVYHHGRRPRAHERTALEVSQPGCSVLGCAARAGLENDHRIDYSKTRITAYDLIDRLCPFHHRKKTFEGWGLVEGRGKRAFVPPGDPRHPRHSAPAPPVRRQ